MKCAIVVFVGFVCSCTFASDPGQPLDCSDWVLSPGLTCSYFYGSAFGGDFTNGKGTDLAIDNLGALLALDQSDGITISRFDPVTGNQPVGFIQNRSNGLGGMDMIEPRCTNLQGCSGGRTNTLIFDPANARLIFSVRSTCGSSCGFPYPPMLSTIVISGFQRLFDVYQSYQPQPAAWTFRVPTSPEALGGVDHFDTYWGALTNPIDFTQAHPLQCGYPVPPPHAGDALTVVDTVPTPAPGQGVYYVTAATYQGATRYGREATAGHLSGRDPALLPACTP